MGLSPAAGVGTLAASKAHAWPGREALFYGGGDHLLRTGRRRGSRLGRFGRRVPAEARRRGLGQAPRVYVVADGGVWLWKLVADRLAAATGGLDFYPASQHLWELAHSLYPENAAGAQAWGEPRRHQLRHGGEAAGRPTLQNLPAWCAQREQPRPALVAKETNYFEHHRAPIHYEARAAEGCPVGSGAMESLCGQLQGRFQRGGQFWTEPGRRRLMALEVARRNHDWDEGWQRN